MARNTKILGGIVTRLSTAFFGTRRERRIAILALAAIGIVFLLLTCGPGSRTGETPPAVHLPPGTNTVALCVWNFENLFDDRDDRRPKVDEEYDDWFARDGAAREMKYRRLAEAILKLNDGRGPDIIVGNEVESPRAAELLQEALNVRLADGAVRYGFVAMKELNAGRHIAPCVISRYPLSQARLLGKLQRILEVRVTANGHHLMLVAAHWTSQLSDKGEDATRGRFGYANTIHAAYAAAVRTNPNVDYLVCGDFNDPPGADSIVKNLHMTGDARRVAPGANPPMLLGLLSSKSAETFGTHYYNQPLIYDQIGISAGLLDESGWGCVVDSVQVPTEGLTRSSSRARRPWRFGSKSDDAQGRGYSDHFPVMVTLTVAP